MLAAAVARAQSGESLPLRWLDTAAQTYAMASKTYAAALGTALLARSVDPRVDPLSIKAEYSDYTYSLRTLGHAVLVPGAQKYGFSIRAKGREPLNNQPFFRYDHMSLIDRVRNPGQHQEFLMQLSQLSEVDTGEARNALASYVRVAFAYQDSLPSYSPPNDSMNMNQVFAITDEYLHSNVVDRPKRLQALVAAAMDVAHNDVGTRKINDPSRDFPGDIQVYDNDFPVLAIEVRGKRVPAGEVLAFAEACRHADIWAAAVVVDWRGHTPLNISALREQAFNETGVIVSVFESFKQLLHLIFGWPVSQRGANIEKFIAQSFRRLEEIEASPDSMREWAHLWSTASDRI
ncbi:restriction endonuclease, SacI family [Arthrobacter sp. D1-17]